MPRTTRTPVERLQQKVRAQLARPYDDGWEGRYMRISCHAQETTDGNLVLVVVTPYEHDEVESSIAAAAEDRDVEITARRSGQGHEETELVAHLTQ